MKKTAAIMMTALGLYMVYPAPTADAGVSPYDAIHCVNDTVKCSVRDTAWNDRYVRGAVYRDISLDGTYYGGKGNGRYHRDGGLLSVNYFTVSRPTVIDIHAVGYDSGNFIFDMYDQDGYQIGNNFYVGRGGTKDLVRVLAPGRYKIEVKYSRLSAKYFGEYKFKIDQTPMIATASQNMTRPERAHLLRYGTNAVNYFKTLNKNMSEYQYYSFEVHQTGDINIHSDQIGGNGRYTVCLLDADERVIHKYYLNKGVIDENISLPRGQYFLRVERNDKAGAVYQLMITR